MPAARGPSLTPLIVFSTSTTAVTDPDLDGETIFVYRTTAGAGSNALGGQDFDFQPSQFLIGEGLSGGAGDDINDVRGFTTQTHSRTLPTINGDQHSVGGTVDILTLATSNTVRGLDIGGTSAGNTGIIGSSVGTLVINDVNVTAASRTGKIIDITGTAAQNIAVTLDTATTTSSTTEGIKLNSITGSFTATTGAISGTTGAAFLIGNGAGGANTGGTATISYGGTITSGTGRAVDIQDRPAGAGNITFSGNITHNVGGQTGVFLDDNVAGTILFSGQTQSIATTTATAVNLTDNTGTTINFAPTAGGNGLDITATSGTGLLATGGGTITVQGSGNSITTSSGRIIQADGITIGANNITFATLGLTSTVAADAISLNNVDSNTFNGGAVTIAQTSVAGSDGIAITGDSSAAFNFTSATIDNTSGDAINLNGENGCRYVHHRRPRWHDGRKRYHGNQQY